MAKLLTLDRLGDIFSQVKGFVAKSAGKTKEEVMEVIDPQTAITLIMDDGTEVSLQGTKIVRNDGVNFEVVMSEAWLSGTYYAKGDVVWEGITTLGNISFYTRGTFADHVSYVDNRFTLENHGLLRLSADYLYAPSSRIIVDEIEVSATLHDIESGTLRLKKENTETGEVETVAEAVVAKQADGISGIKIKLPEGIECDNGTRLIQLEFECESDAHGYVIVIDEIRVKGHTEQGYYESAIGTIGEWDDPETINQQSDEADTFTEHSPVEA